MIEGVIFVWTSIAGSLQEWAESFSPWLVRHPAQCGDRLLAMTKTRGDSAFQWRAEGETMDDTLRRALRRGLTCDITTTGRISGQPRRIEIWYFMIAGQVYLTGTPGRRDWYANLLANPRLIFHVKEHASVDLPAFAVPVTDPVQRRRIMAEVLRQNSWFSSQQYSLEDWVAGSPLVALEFDRDVGEADSG